jgi:hypothetical protein
MDALEKCIAVYANLLEQFKELDELRERVAKAKALVTAMPAPLKQEPVSFH